MSLDTDKSSDARERELFLSALEISAPEKRAAFLSNECGSDRDLQARVENLLKEVKQVGGFMETPVLPRPGEQAGSAVTDVSIESVTEKPGDRIGRYKLLQKIGEGGVGVVYMAEQEEPVRRRVAIKVIKLGMDTRSIIARFEVERQALAMMEHPNIARVFDAGATETGRPFFAMELVQGVKITEYCDASHLPTRERLALFIQVCHAIQHAHQKGIIHRDIKPSNILVTLHDGTPVPKVIDFGIAKATEQRLTDKTLFTEFSMFIGTPAYMSPEQAQMSALDIDTRSDLYSLGVLLYELLVGRTPFDPEALMQVGLDECRRTICEREPARPSTRLTSLAEVELTTTAQQRGINSPQLVSLLRGDLDWIAMKCLEKDRTRRYATVNDLILDVQRYLNGEAVLARPPSNVYRFQKFVRRHQAAIGAAVGIAVTLLAGTTVSLWQAVRATNAQHQAREAQGKEAALRHQAEMENARAERERAWARLNEYVADINLAQQSLAAGNLGRAVQLLNKHLPAPGETDLRGFEWRYLWQLCQGDEHARIPFRPGSIHSLAVSPHNDFLAIGQGDKIGIWDLRSQSQAASIPHGGFSLSFFPKGDRLISASPRTVRLWSATNWGELNALPGHRAPVAMSPDAAQLATVSWQGVHVWDTATLKEAHFLPEATDPLAFSPDGKTLATGAKNGLTLWPLEEGRSAIVLEDSTNLFARGGPWFISDRVIAFSPDGASLVAARNTLSERGVFVISIWDTRTGQEKGVMPRDAEHIEHTGVISSLAFSPDGRVLATASMDYSIRLWDLATQQRIGVFQGHQDEVWTAAFSSDGQQLYTGAKDGSIHVWPMRPKPKEEIFSGSMQPMAFSADSQTLAGLAAGTNLIFLDLKTGGITQQFQLERRRGRFGGPEQAVALSADLRALAQGREDGTVELWNTESRESTSLKVSDRPVDFVGLTKDAQFLITGGRFQGLRLWDLRQSTSSVLETEARRALFSPDGKTIAAFARDSTIELWNVATGALRTNLVSEAAPGFSAAFSADGTLLAVACFDDAIRLWNTTSGALLGTCIGHKQAVFSVAFSPDGRTLASASEDRTLKLWNVATKQELLSLRRMDGAMRSLLFSPDGRLLVGNSITFSPNDGLRFYRAPLFSEIMAQSGGTPGQPPAANSP